MKEFYYVLKSRLTRVYGNDTQNAKQNTHTYYFSELKEKSEQTPKDFKPEPEKLETTNHISEYIEFSLETGPI